MSVQTRHQVYMVIRNMELDHFLGRTWDVEKFLDEVEKIYGEESKEA